MAGKNEIGSEDTFEDKCEGWSKDGGVADVDREAVSTERGQWTGEEEVSQVLTGGKIGPRLAQWLAQWIWGNLTTLKIKHTSN